MRAAGADQVGEDAEGSGNGFRKLPVKRVGGVDVDSLAVADVEQAAALWGLVGVVGFGKGLVAAVPGGHEGMAALLDPSVEVGGSDVVGPLEKRIIRVGQSDGVGFLHNFLRIAAKREGIRAVIVEGSALVLHDEGSAVVDVVEKAAVIGDEIG